MSGLLILTLPIKRLIPLMPQILNAASEHVEKSLYIHVDQSVNKNGSLQLYSQLLEAVHFKCIYSVVNNLNIHLLMSGIKYKAFPAVKLSELIDVIMIDCESSLQENLNKMPFQFIRSTKTYVLLNDAVTKNVQKADYNLNRTSEKNDKIYESVVLGGTFDHLHNGHKLLLTEAVLRCKKQLVIGVSDGPLLERKILKELISPIDERINFLRNYLVNIDPSLQYIIGPLYDPMGPAGNMPELEMIVVSKETFRGATAINECRKKKGLSKLDIYCIDMLQDTLENEHNESKLSSSAYRISLLGKLLRPVQVAFDLHSQPYIIGLCGSSASGKTSVAKYLCSLGAAIIDCDKLGHQAYSRGTDCYDTLIKTFGKGILNADGEIERSGISKIVFNDSALLSQLNVIVWPEVTKFAKKQIDDYYNKGFKVVVLDAALLLEAGWEMFCHQIWVCIIQKKEALNRIIERDACTLESAEKRLQNQMPNEEKVKKAHIVLCTQWSVEFTQKQVDKAWSELINLGVISAAC